MSDVLLIIEDEALFGGELARHYRREGWNVVHVPDLAQARALLQERRTDPLVVLSDMSLPDGNALDLLESLREAGPAAEWVFLTGYGGVADSVRALRLGAYDFLEKPCDLNRLDLIVAGAARSARAQRRLQDEAAERNRRYPVDAFVGTSEAAQRLRDMLERLAKVPFSALLLSGETGTGKGLAARILHHSGTRRAGPLVEINCAALPRELLESELFGVEPGAFTGAKGRRRGLFEQAHGGTFFLDEIGELGLDLQSKLLKVIEDRSVRRLGGSAEVQVDLQIVAASNRKLSEQVQEGKFRADLFHRLSVFTLDLPPLRERLQDIAELVPLFVAEFNAKAGKSVRSIPEPVWERLSRYAWPGNVRELRNVVERCVLLAEGDVFPARWLQLPAEAGTAEMASTSHDGKEGLWLPLDGSVSLDDMDRYIIKSALQRAHDNVTAAARLLGTTRQTLRYRVQKYGLKSDD